MLKVLFVCARNQWRSPTAEKVFSTRSELQVRSAGLSSKSSRRLSVKDLEWADLILVMEKEHKQRIIEQYRDTVDLPPLYSLDIPDSYKFMDPELIEILLQTVEPLLLKFLQKDI